MLRWQRVLLGVVVLFLTLTTGIFQLSSWRFECWHADGKGPMCVVSRSAPFAHVQRFPPGSISAVQVNRRAYGRAGSAPTFEVVLLDRRGAETRLHGFKSEAAANADRDHLKAFLANPESRPIIEERPSSPWVYVLMIVGIGIGVAILGAAIRESSKPSPSFVTPPRRQIRWLRLTGVGVVSFVLLGAVVYFPELTGASRTFLEIRAEYRCMFDGIEHLPGGWMRTGIRSGTYSILVWDPDPTGHWQEQFVDVLEGQTTIFVCRPKPKR